MASILQSGVFTEGSRKRLHGEKLHNPLTLLHISDLQFGKNHRFGQLGLNESINAEFDTLFQRLSDDLALMEKDGIIPQAVIISGDLAEWGEKKEFTDALQFLIKLTERLKIQRRNVIIIPGNHDINRKLCEGYFLTCEGEGENPQKPYWPKWKHYHWMFKEFYQTDVDKITFTEKEPWTFYELGDLKLVVAGLNSTMTESHKAEDHYGEIGEPQLNYFADKLKPFHEQGWFRLGVVHHNALRGAKADDENLRDFEDLKRILGPSINLLLHGHTHKDDLGWIDSTVPIISTGSAALTSEARPEEVGNQYQIVRLWPNCFERRTRRYDPDGKRWIGDTRCSPGGDKWHFEKKVEFVSVHGIFPPQMDFLQDSQIEAEGRRFVEVDKPLDAALAGLKLKSLPRFRLRIEDQHGAVRQHERSRLAGLLKDKRAAWLVSDWGLGKEGFLACALGEVMGGAAMTDVFRLQCGSVKDCAELLSEAETQLGLSFQEFFAAIAVLPWASLVFDDLPHEIVSGKERDTFEQKVRPIFDFCPNLRLVFIARQQPTATDPNEVVLLRPLDIPETRSYLRNHARARSGLDGDFELERIHAWSGGLPMHLDRLLERLQFFSLSSILDEDISQPFLGVTEPLLESLRKAVAKLTSSDNKHTKHSLRLLKVLTILRDGETYQSIRRFYPTEPFHQSHIDELVSLALLEDVPIMQTAADLTPNKRSISPYSNLEPPKLLRVPRQVRDHVNFLITTDEREGIINASTGLFFGPKWWKGKIKLRTSLSDAYGQSAIAGPGNEHLVAKHLLAQTLAKGKKLLIERYAGLANAYCQKLIASDRFRDALIASAGIVELLKDTDYQEFYVQVAHIYAKSLRMVGREGDAVEVLKDILTRGEPFLIDEHKAKINLTLVFAYNDLDMTQEALAVANDVLKLVDSNSETAYEAKAQIAEMTLKGGNLKAKLIELEQSARNHSHDHAANNIAIKLAYSATAPEEVLPLLQKVIYTARDNYNRTRAIVKKASVLVKHSRVAELSEYDRMLLGAAYSYSYGQRIGNLLDSCHRVLWDIYKRDGLIASLLRLFRFSSFIWRLKGLEDKEAEYLVQLASADLDKLKITEGKVLHFEILYLEHRRGNHARTVDL